MFGRSRYTIRPVCVGTLTIDKSHLVFGVGYGEKIDSAVCMWYVEGAGRRIMVDTGCCDPEWSAKYHYPLKRTPEQEPRTALAAIGVDPADIDTVVCTHLHWDHCYNHELFTKARFYVQKTELQYAAAPHPMNCKAYESITIGMTPPYLKTRFEVVDGDLELAQGLKLYFAPGHTPGMQGLAVDTKAGVYFVASDNLPLYLNWEGNQLQKHIPGINFVNVDDYYRTFKLIERVADHILPGHDPKMLEKAVYP